MSRGCAARRDGDVANVVAGDAARDQRGTEEGVLAGEQFAGVRDVDEGAALFVHLHVVHDVEVGHQCVTGADETVVEVEGLGPG